MENTPNKFKLQQLIKEKNKIIKKKSLKKFSKKGKNNPPRNIRSKSFKLNNNNKIKEIFFRRRNKRIKSKKININQLKSKILNNNNNKSKKDLNIENEQTQKVNYKNNLIKIRSKRKYIRQKINNNEINIQNFNLNNNNNKSILNN